MNCILTNELHIDEWTGPLTNGLDQLTNYTKFAPRLEHYPAPSALGEIGHMTHTAIIEPTPTGYLLAA